MGAVLQKIKLINWLDSERARLGQISASDIRVVEVEALVDMDATTLILPNIRMGASSTSCRRPEGPD